MASECCNENVSLNAFIQQKLKVHYGVIEEEGDDELHRIIRHKKGK